MIGILIRLILIALIASACEFLPDSPSTSPPYTSFDYIVNQEGPELRIHGNSYEITDRNCGGATDAIRTEERSQTYLAELDVEISSEVSAEFGGDVQVAKAVIIGKVGASLGVRFGAQTEVRSSVVIVTPPGKKSITILQWKENWTKGNIAIIRSDGSYIGVIPFTALNTLVLERLSETYIDCETGEEEPQQSTPQQLPTVIPQFTPIPTPMYMGQITVVGNSNSGIKFSAPASGQYTFEFASGAYSTYAIDNIPSAMETWLTSVWLFKNQPIQWNGRAISEYPEVRGFDYKYSSSAEAAELKAKQQKITVHLLQGDVLILVAIDHFEAYADNPGEVRLNVYFIP